MPYVILVILLALFAAAGWGLSRGRAGSGRPIGGQTVSAPRAVSRFISQEKIRMQLSRLASRPVKKNLAVGAMCYAIAPPAAHGEYVCPDCGAKTLYAFDYSDPNQIAEGRRIVWQLREVEDCRRLAGQIERLSIRLDERSFCRNCSPDVKEVGLAIVVSYPEERLTHRCEGVGRRDLELIRAFVDGRAVFKEFNDSETALKDYLPRLEELLVVTEAERQRRFLSREEIRQKLEETAGRPLPSNLSMGAMCYEVVGPPQRIDYVCPACGEKTLYAVHPEDPNRLSESYRIAGQVSELEDYRRLAEQIEGLSIRLDERSFCRACSPEVKGPVLELVVEYPEEGREHRTANPTAEDLMMLRAFLDGKASYKNARDGEIPLRLCMKRLETLLGVTLQDDVR